MDGDFYGKLAGGISKGYAFMSTMLSLLILIIIFGIGWAAKITLNRNIKETKTKPAITWRLEAEGQKVDTIWIYDFEK